MLLLHSSFVYTVVTAVLRCIISTPIYNIYNIYPNLQYPQYLPYLQYPQYLPMVSRIQTLVDSIVAGEAGTRARHYSRHMGTAGHAVY